MAQRHESLIPLAKDHYEGLLLVQPLREHHRPIITGWPQTTTERARFVAQFYDEHLKQAEEQAFFPPASVHIPATRGIVQELLHEHRMIEEYVISQRIRKLSCRGPATVCNSARGTYSERRPRVVFPLLEKEAAPEVLETIKQKMGPYYHE